MTSVTDHEEEKWSFLLTSRRTYFNSTNFEIGKIILLKMKLQLKGRHSVAG